MNRADEIKVITIKVIEKTTTKVTYKMAGDRGSGMTFTFVARDAHSKNLITNFKPGNYYAVQQKVLMMGTGWVKAVQIDACGNQLTNSKFEPLEKKPYFPPEEEPTHQDLTAFIQ